MNARESTPRATLHRQHEDLQDEAIGYAQRAIPNEPPDVKQKMASHMVENYNMGLAVGHTVDEQIRYAIMQTRHDLARGVIDGMKRNEMMTEIFQGSR